MTSSRGAGSTRELTLPTPTPRAPTMPEAAALPVEEALHALASTSAGLVRDRLSERRAHYASDLGDGGARCTALLHPSEDRIDVGGPDLRDLEAADDGHDLPADVALECGGVGPDLRKMVRLQQRLRLRLRHSV